ncbi:hypothetical protein PACILC2_00650 [Paenibacillus cisolokensis]|uniref:AraC-type arabinose-binding/dimerisation domain-containing protein n=1 Tax=Paenibacillus cisolokensis TaxID=1658519 RepID=A0ABQ4N005_9BACL|nr:AraC family ligand binding domain-containing protein [Paenibacillus cisolokensis]GIQ61497.1 hypothetical protein PACILC2_00650 [Paenibacillus cisolokensis]
MNPLFEPMKLEGKPVMWNGRQRTEADFSGYYHWHQCAEMLLVHEGRGSVVVGRHAYEIRRGMLFFFRRFSSTTCLPMSVRNALTSARSFISIMS